MKIVKVEKGAAKAAAKDAKAPAKDGKKAEEEKDKKK